MNWLGKEEKEGVFKWVINFDGETPGFKNSTKWIQKLDNWKMESHVFANIFLISGVSVNRNYVFIDKWLSI